jgi:hypothetical protein
MRATMRLMTNHRHLSCEQCGAAHDFEGEDAAGIATAIETAGWSTYGAGVTPLAEELNAGLYQCSRCGVETSEQRVKRLTNDVLRSEGVAEMWAASYAPGEKGHLTIWTDPEPTKFDFDLQRTDEETRSEIGRAFARVYDRKKS